MTALGRGGARAVRRGMTAARGQLVVTIADDGVGLPADFDAEAPERLGMQIVRTLVSAELAGTIEHGSGDGHGVSVVLSVPMGHKPRVGG